MVALARELRRLLESTVRNARKIAEQGVRQELSRLAVEEAKPGNHLKVSDKDLRLRLRSHGRMLGDIRDPKRDTQEIDRLVEEGAYEHWHRLLFARFLAENSLLIEPEHGVPISLDDCRELARVRQKDWLGLASQFAQKMLPQIFRPGNPVLELRLPPEKWQALEKLVEDLPQQVFQADDSLGWVYQFWQAEKKDEVNASGVKIGARELPAVTQLFTEDYMVQFLLDNSLGAWWAAQRLSEDDLKSAKSEQELRTKAVIPGVPLKYLRFAKKEDGSWTPAAGTFEAWPKDLKEFKVLDPCCGSGHFLVAAMLMLAPIRMEMERLDAQEAVCAILKENLHGLEIDKRCVELAAFALALTAWRFPNAGGHRTLPEIHLACSGLSVTAAKDEWSQLGLGKQNLRLALEWMYETFTNAPILGSLLNPNEVKATKIIEKKELTEALNRAILKEKSTEQNEVGVVAQGLTKALSLLVDRYHWIITNVPYLGRGKQGEILSKYCEEYFPEGRNDLATVFLERCLQYCIADGEINIVLPQNWLFSTTYRKLREKLLKNEVWHIVVRLGAGAFDTISGEVVKAILISIKRKGLVGLPGSLFGNGNAPQIIRGLDVSGCHNVEEKARSLIESDIKNIIQAKQLENPDARILFEEQADFDLLSTYVAVPQGIKTGDDNKFRVCYWEIGHQSAIWKKYQSTPYNNDKNRFSGMNYLLRWEDDGNNLARRQGEAAWGKKGIALSQMNELSWGFYLGDIQDSNINVVIPQKDKMLLPVVAFVASKEFANQVRQLDQKLSVTNATIGKVPFNLEYWEKVSKEKYPNGLPKPYCNDPIQWVFHGHPCGTVLWDDLKKSTTIAGFRTDDTVLQVAIARLLGYRWPAELDPFMELCNESRTLVKQVEDLLPLADKDGIICLQALCGEAAAVDRLKQLLTKAYGSEWGTGKLNELLAATGRQDGDLERWLRDDFFAGHCQVFHQRPFIWHIWDGHSQGFSALVNYHKLAGEKGEGKRTLEKLIYSYLGEWINKQKAEQKTGKEGADARLAAAEHLKGELEAIMKGEPPYDIFVRWKPLHQQAIGWAPDINDGVRLNIRPFMQAKPFQARAKNASILRVTPKIDWSKDRGNEVHREKEEYPWFWSWDESSQDFEGGKKFDGKRWNDLHYTRAFKEKKLADHRGKV